MAMAIWPELKATPEVPSTRPRPRLVHTKPAAESRRLEATAFQSVCEGPVDWSAVRQAGRVGQPSR